MIEIISTQDHERLNEKLQRIRQRNVALDPELLNQVATIISDVRARGDVALIEYTQKLDNHLLEAGKIRISEDALQESASSAPREVNDALDEAIDRVRNFHEHEKENSWSYRGENGVVLGQRITPIERAGLYVPGGTASYPSSVVMNVVPAQIAGVNRIVVTTPPRTLQENRAVAAALVKLKINEVYACGGAQAIAALAFGTETVPRVDIITGPGNRYVAAAKKLVFGMVGIDSIAGPSEVVVIADQTARPTFVASDLLAQAEHAPDTSAILVTTSESLALEVRTELDVQMRGLSRAGVMEKALANYGAIVVARDMDEACALVNELAPEHLEIMAADEESLASRIPNVGAIFLGEHSPAAVGDYLAGPNHVLPTGGAARFSSALSVRDFMKRTSIVKFSAEELELTAAKIAALARAEGFEAHARSALIRGQD